MKILVVEDDFASRKLLCNFMSKHGMCDGAADGMEAVNAFRTSLEEEEPYDLIMMDIMMPNLDGMGALKLIRGMESGHVKVGAKHTIVIMISAFINQSTMDSAKELGCDAFIQKPIDFEKVKNEIRRAGLLE